MSHEQYQVQCPKCGHMSSNPDTCESCGVLLTRMRGRSYNESKITRAAPQPPPAPPEFIGPPPAPSKLLPYYPLMGIVGGVLIVALGFWLYQSRKPAILETTSDQPRKSRVRQATTATLASDTNTTAVAAVQAVSPAQSPPPAINTPRARRSIQYEAPGFITTFGDSLISLFMDTKKKPPASPRGRRATAAISTSPLTMRELAVSSAGTSRTSSLSYANAVTTGGAPYTLASIDINEEMFQSGSGAGRTKLGTSAKPVNPGTHGNLTPFRTDTENGSAASIPGNSFAAEVLAYGNGPVLVDFYATWCGPCKLLSPRVEQVAVEFKDRLKVVKVDVDESPDLPRKYNVGAYPTLIVFKGGREVARSIGAIQVEQLRQFVQAQM